MHWREVAARQHGVITRTQLTALGVTRGGVRTLCERGDLLAAGRRGLWFQTGTPKGHLTRFWAAVLTTDGVLSHRCAAVALDMTRYDPSMAVDVTIDRRRRVEPIDGVHIHRSDLAEADVTTVDGLRVTSLQRTALDCIIGFDMPDARRFLDRALQKKWLLQSDIVSRVTDEPRRPGNGRLKQLMLESGESAAERKLHQLLRDAGVTGWEPNHEIDVGFAVLTFDVVFPACRLVVEVDGWAFHQDRDRFQSDRRRQNALVQLGWRVLRFTWIDLVERPRYVVRSTTETIGH